MPESADQLQIVRQLRQTNQQLLNENELLKAGGPGGTSGGMTDDWKASVDRQLDQLHKDIRALLRWGVAAVIALAAMIAGLYLRTNDRFDTVAQRTSAIEVQQAHILDKIDIILDRTAPKK